MADPSITPVAAPSAGMSAADPSGPTIDPATFDGVHAYEYPGVVYDAATFTPGSPAITPA